MLSNSLRSAPVDLARGWERAQGTESDRAGKYFYEFQMIISDRMADSISVAMLSQ